MPKFTLKLSAIAAAIALSLTLSSGAFAQDVVATGGTVNNSVLSQPVTGPLTNMGFGGLTWGQAIGLGVFGASFASLAIEVLDDDYTPPASTSTTPTTN